MAYASPATPARVHFLCADSGLGKTTALAEFARRATAAAQPVAGVLSPVAPDGLRKLVSLRTGEQRDLQMVPLTAADAEQRAQRLRATDARPQGPACSAAAEARAAALEHGVAVGPFVFDARVFQWAREAELCGDTDWAAETGAEGAGPSPELSCRLGPRHVRWVIIDEVGPLEMHRHEGLEPALSRFLSARGLFHPRLASEFTCDVIVVVRPSLRGRIVEYLGLPPELCDDVQYTLKDGHIDPLSLGVRHSSGPPKADFPDEASWRRAAAGHVWGPAEEELSPTPAADW